MISVVSNMVVTESDAESMLNSKVIVKWLTRQEIEYHLHNVWPCHVKLQRLHIPRGRAVIYKCHTVYAKTVGGHLRKPEIDVNHNLLQIFNSSYQKDPSGPGNQVSCVDCSKKFKNDRSMLSNWKSHSGDFKFECPFCDKRFLNKHHHATHKHLHRNILNFPCLICNKKFLRLPVLRHHIRAEHGQCFECHHCDKEFASAKVLWQHLIEVDKLLICKKCWRTYAQYASLFRHLQTCTT